MDRCEIWVKHVVRNERMTDTLLVVHGRNGCGKSTAAKGLVKYFNAYRMWAFGKGFWGVNPPSLAIFVDWAKIAETKPDERDDFWRECSDASLLVLDDVGADTDRFRSEVSTDNFRRMLQHRERRFTMVTTNVPPAQWQERWDARVADRLLRNADVFEIANAPSWAVLKFKEKQQT